MKRMKNKVIAIFAAMVLAGSITTAIAVPSVSAAESQSAFLIAAGTSTGGRISPEGMVSVASGTNKTFQITPNAGYAVNEVIVDGTRVGAVSSYTFQNVSSNHSIVASFKKANESSYATRLLKTDTRSYTMAPGDIYDVKIEVEGANIAQGDIQVSSSRSGIASVRQMTNNTYRITGLSVGTTYIIAEVGGTHASIRVDVKANTKQGGESCRSVSIVSADYVSNGNTVTNPSGKISLEQAKQIALKHAGLSASQVTFAKAKQDYENGRVVYDVEFYHNYNEYDYEIDATTGAIVKYDYDIENSGTVTTPIGLMSPEKAKEIALNHARLSASSVRNMEISLDSENGLPIYEVSFQSGRVEYEYEINGRTGTILKYDKDYD